jgi:TatD DNase family protein
LILISILTIFKKVGREMSLPDLLALDVGAQPTSGIVCGGGVSDCDPKFLPVRIPRENSVVLAVGVHPSHANEYSTHVYNTLKELLRDPVVRALGEIGLDFSLPPDSLDLQERVFIDLLGLAMNCRPIVLHVRGRTHEDGGEVPVYHRALQILKANVSPVQRIHLHCFTGTVEEVMSWSSTFQHCYFGITNQVARFNRYQQAALRRIPLNRPLVETDSPYFEPVGARMNTPAFIGDTVRSVSGLLGVEIGQLVQHTNSNMLQLYEW